MDELAGLVISGPIGDAPTHDSAGAGDDLELAVFELGEEEEMQR